MRAKSKWSPGSVLLWLIAAVLATMVVCSQSKLANEIPAASDEVEIELELIE